MTSIGVGLIIAAGKRVSIKSRFLVKEALNTDNYKGIVKLVKSVLLVTLCFEIIGAVLSFLVFSRDYPTLHAIGISIFHSIAAFNNSGFDILGGLRNLIPLPERHSPEFDHLFSDHLRRSGISGHSGYSPAAVFSEN